jgi:nucleotide-binding universal stress UspA family protein
MQNPLRSEGEAFRFLWVVIAGAALIVIGSVIDRWVGLAVAILVLAAVSWWIARTGRREPPVRQTPLHDHPADERRVLVIANETVGGSKLRSCISEKTEGYHGNVLVVAPALNSPLRYWVSDEDGARAGAEKRVQATVARLKAAGLDVRGEVGDPEPLQAIEDALRTFGADEIVISTHPEGRSNWLEQGLIEKARERFAVPITHVVVDLDAEEPEEVVQ